ncbi:MAG: zinc-binding dehydrogenase [Deltaproteobacteria bacterium]|nr:zinc-binding dehydrogenase [Deltaproteobacteria bacterium]
MKSMVLEKFGSPLVLRRGDMPKPGPDEAILSVGACGVCQTDLKILQGKHPAARKLPLVPGHEVAGEVVQVGSDADRSAIGRHAVVYSYQVCGTCEFCRQGRENLCVNIKGQVGMSRDGGYAEFIKVPFNSLLFIPERIPFEKAAIVTDAVATPYHALVSKAKIKEGDIVLVMGAGGLGLNAVQLARLMGARVVAVDIRDDALERAKEFGAQWIVDAKKEGLVKGLKRLTGGGVDTVLDLTGDAKMQSMGLEILKRAGRFVMVGYNPSEPWPVPPIQVVANEIEIYGSRWCGKNELKECIELVTESKIAPFVGEIHPLEEANSVLERLKKGEILGRAVLVP